MHDSDANRRENDVTGAGREESNTEGLVRRGQTKSEKNICQMHTIQRQAGF